MRASRRLLLRLRKSERPCQTDVAAGERPGAVQRRREETMITVAKRIAAAVGGAALLVAIGAASAAHAEMCNQFDLKNVGNTIVQNNRWNDKVAGEQCIAVLDQGPGFAITKQTGSAPDGEPVSYPSIYIGCHYSNCSPGTNLPIAVESIEKAETRINIKYASDPTFVFDAAYDIWLDPSPIRDGENEREIMIWLDRQGDIHPIGRSPVGSAKIADRTWQVWCGPNGKTDVISYVAPSAISNISFSVLDFITSVRDFVARFPECGKKIDGFYLTSIQAGFEPWKGGVDLAIERFQASVDAKQPAGR